jgi:hypothetical protein
MGALGAEDMVWREGREENVGWNRKWLVFWLTLDQLFSSSGAWKSNLFIGGGRGTLCLLWCKLSTLGSTRKHLNHWFKVVMMNCQFCAGKMVGRVATLGRCHRLYSLDQSERFILACSQVSGDRFRASFI